MLPVRDLSPSEGEANNHLMNRTRDPTVMRRAEVVLHSNQGFSPPKIAAMLFWSEEWVRRVIKDFNRKGKDALSNLGGRPPAHLYRPDSTGPRRRGPRSPEAP